MRSHDGDREAEGGDLTACASSSVDSPPASAKRPRDAEADAEAPRKKAKCQKLSLTSKEAQHKPQSGPAMPQKSLPTRPIASDTHGGSHIIDQWGTLMSQYPQHPDIILRQKRVMFGRNPVADVTFKDARVAFEVCSIKLVTEGGVHQAKLHCLSDACQLSCNGRRLHKNERVVVLGGDVLLLVGQEPYSFVFEPCNNRESCAPEPATSEAQDGTEQAPVSPQAACRAGNAAETVPPEGPTFSSDVNLCPAACHDELPRPLGDGGGSEQGDLAPDLAPVLASDTEPEQHQEAASGLAAGLANVRVQKPPPESLHISRDVPCAPALMPRPSWRTTADGIQGRQPPVKVSSDHVTIIPAVGGQRTQPVASAAGRASKPGTSASRTGKRSSQLADTGVAATANQRTTLGAAPPGEAGLPALLSQTPMQQPWAAWIQKQAETARTAAAQATAVAASAVVAMSESSPLQGGPSTTMLRKLVTDMERSLERQPGKDDPSVSWANFPHFVAEGTRAVLQNTAFLHLQRPAFTRMVSGVTGLCNRIWLSGPTGSELYQEQLVRALAKENGAQLLQFDLAALVPQQSQLQGGANTRGSLAAGVTVPGSDPLQSDDLDQSTCDEDEEIDDWAAELKGCTAPGWATPHFAAMARQSAQRSRGRADTFRRLTHGMTQLSQPPTRDAARDNLYHRQQTSVANPADFSSSTASQPLKRGDRVRLIASSATGLTAGSGGSRPGAGGFFKAGRRLLLSGSGLGSVPAAAKTQRGPALGQTGTVVMTFPDNPDRIGVGFDAAVPAGINLGGACPQGHGFFCSARQLALERQADIGGADWVAASAAVDAFLDFVTDVSRSAPLVVFLKDAAKTVTSQVASRLCGAVGERMHTMASQRLLIIAGHCDPPEVRMGYPALGGFAAMLGAPTAMPGGLHHLLDGMHGRTDFRSAASPAAAPGVVKMLSRMLPNHVTLTPPSSEPMLSKWNRMLEEDGATLRQKVNAATLSKACSKLGLECKDIHAVAPSEGTLSRAQAERVVGWALSSLLIDPGVLLPPQTAGPPLQLPHSCLKTALATHASIIQAEGVTAGSRFKDLRLDNEFEKKLLEEVIPPDEVGTTFDDIGAQDAVKASLQEVVMLPLQRPELFKRGTLTKPTKGVLLFGPPGTGKTMLAKAVAAESGANFINISMSALASKWFGEGERYVKALFSLAHRLAPAIIFVDEVDSILSRREKAGEHEAMRKIKNEFMSHWDGLRTNNTDRVLVLAATNRPGDLDEAVIRRMPRRLMVDLPDGPNRARILKVILKDEVLEAGFNLEEVAELTGGYSGSDLKALCIAAAYRPIRDLLATEAAATAATASSQKAVEAGSCPPDTATDTARTAQSPTAAAPDDAKATASASDIPNAKSSDQGVSSVDTPAATAPELDRRLPAGTVTSPTTAAAAVLGSCGLQAVAGRPMDAVLRPLTTADMKEAMKQVGASNSADAVSMSEMRQWNEMYGEGGSRKAQQPTYFM